MSRVLRSVRKRKKGRTLGAVDVIDREGYAELEVDAKVELIRSLIPLGLMHIEELLDEEVTALAGERYARKDPSVGGRRHGSNPDRPRGGLGIHGVGLPGDSTGAPVAPVHFEHLVPGSPDRARESRPVAAGALDAERGDTSVTLGPGDQLLVAV